MRKLSPILAASIALLLFVPSAMAFGPCKSKMPVGISYLPEVEVCGGKAAIVLTGKYYGSFSAVVRDCNNNDRDPCHPGVGSCGTNQSSPFKVQKVVNAVVLDGGKTKRARIQCLKEKGDSEVYKLVRRTTIKLRNPIRSDKDIVKICLRSRIKAVNDVQIVSTSTERPASNEGYNSACKTQGYLNCDYSYQAICPQY